MMIKLTLFLFKLDVRYSVGYWFTRDLCYILIKIRVIKKIIEGDIINSYCELANSGYYS